MFNNTISVKNAKAMILYIKNNIILNNICKKQQKHFYKGD